MKTLLKSLAGFLMLAFILALLIPAKAFADAGTLSFNLTNSYAGGAGGATTSSLTNQVKVDKQDRAAIIFTGALTGSGSSNIVFTFARSADGTNFETTPQFTWQVTPNGTTTVVAWTNMDVTTLGPASYLRLVSIVNSNTVPITNGLLQLGVKTIKAAP